MQAGIIQHPAFLVKPVDPSVTTAILCGQLLGLNGSGNVVLPDAAGADLIGIATADQDVDENTIDFVVKTITGGATTGGNSAIIGLVVRVKITTGSVTLNQDLWLDGTNGGVTATKPGTTPVWIGRALEIGGVGELIMAFV